MGSSRYQFYPDVWNDDIQHTLKGIVDYNLLKQKLLNENEYNLYTIPIEYVYRPDLIALNFFNDDKLYWVLAFVNDINDSPTGFYQGRVIKIPNPKRIMELL